MMMLSYTEYLKNGEVFKKKNKVYACASTQKEKIENSGTHNNKIYEEFDTHVAMCGQEGQGINIQ